VLSAPGSPASSTYRPPQPAAVGRWRTRLQLCQCRRQAARVYKEATYMAPLATPKVSNIIFFFSNCLVQCYNYCVSYCLTRYRLSFVPNFIISVASILLATPFMTAVVCRRWSHITNQRGPQLQYVIYVFGLLLCPSHL
jgi:hypothetical protein